MLKLAEDIAAAKGVGFSVDAYVYQIDGVPMVEYVVEDGHCGFVRSMTAAEAREVAAYLVRDLDGHDASDRAAITRFARMFLETAEVAEAGGVQ
jgi:hypothetical protein